MTIGERIRQARDARGLTQKQLGAISGTSEITIRQYELGKRQPRIEQLQAIAAALNVSVGFLLEKFDDDEPISFVVSTSELQNYISNKKAPTPVSDDGLDEQERKLVGLMKLLTADQKEFLYAQLLGLIERESKLLKSVPAKGPQPPPIPQKGNDTTPTADGPEIAPEGE